MGKCIESSVMLLSPGENHILTKKLNLLGPFVQSVASLSADSGVCADMGLNTCKCNQLQ